jgi:hypothetical protein
MSAQNPVVSTRVIDQTKPLAQLQEYLVAGKNCVNLLNELLLSLKDMLFTAALIISFVWLAIYLIGGIHG